MPHIVDQLELLLYTRDVATGIVTLDPIADLGRVTPDSEAILMVIGRAMQPVVLTEARSPAIVRHGPASHPFAFAAFPDALAGEL